MGAISMVQLTVLSQEKIATDIYSLWLKWPEPLPTMCPGQFVNLYTKDKSKLLPRPISICEIQDGRIRIVYRVTSKDAGTATFASLKPNDFLMAMGPLGNGYSCEKLQSHKSVLLVGGGIGIPPLLELAKELSGVQVHAVLGYRDELFLKEEFEAYCPTYIATEDGSVGIKGTVVDCMKSMNLAFDVICACGPTPMLKAVKTFAKDTDTTCYISLEERMACGVGACLGCVCKTKEIDSHSNVKNQRVCKEGPVFLSGTVEL